MGGPGFIYVLINPSMPGLVKVGRTTRDPLDRAAELSSATGVAVPFVVVFQEFFVDCESAEAFVHAVLERQGYRVATNREFFQADVSDVIKAVIATPGRTDSFAASVTPDAKNRLPEDVESSQGEYPSNPIAEDIFQEGMNHYLGAGKTLQDYGEALRLFKQATKLGMLPAFRIIGEMYACGNGVKKDPSAALDYFSQAVNRGDVHSYAEMALLFREAGHTQNELKAWRGFFDGISSVGFVVDATRSVGTSIMNFLTDDYGALASFISSGVIPPDYLGFFDIIRDYRQEVIKTAEWRFNHSLAKWGASDDFTKKQEALLQWVLAL